MNPRELSPWSMFVSADALVKAVILSLILASLLTWTVFLAKAVQLALAQRRLRRRLKRLDVAATLTEAQSAAGGGKNVLSTLVSTVVDEVRVSARTEAGGVQARAASRLAEVVRSGSCRITLGRCRAFRGTRGEERDGSPRHHRLHGAVRRSVRHGVGHHEQLHRNLESANHESRGGRAGDRRGVVGRRPSGSLPPYRR
jgi:hypothetical protein